MSFWAECRGYANGEEQDKEPARSRTFFTRVSVKKARVCERNLETIKASENRNIMLLIVKKASDNRFARSLPYGKPSDVSINLNAPRVSTTLKMTNGGNKQRFIKSKYRLTPREKENPHTNLLFLKGLGREFEGGQMFAKQTLRRACETDFHLKGTPS